MASHTYKCSSHHSQLHPDIRLCIKTCPFLSVFTSHTWRYMATWVPCDLAKSHSSWHRIRIKWSSQHSQLQPHWFRGCRPEGLSSGCHAFGSHALPIGIIHDANKSVEVMADCGRCSTCYMWSPVACGACLSKVSKSTSLYAKSLGDVSFRGRPFNA
jgi:hypothetical protein